MLAWEFTHYEQNDDYPELNDKGAWFAHVRDGRQFLAVVTNDETRAAVEVTGDLQAALPKLKAASKAGENWPSVWLGPTDEGLWDEALADLGLERVGAPDPGFEPYED